MILAFAGLRIFAVLGVQAVHFNDTSSYFEIDFFGGSLRLWTVPVIYNLLPTDDLRVVGQALLAVLAWSALAVATARSVDHPALARIGAALILLLGLTTSVTEWDVILLSESVAISLTVAVVAVLLWIRRDPSMLAFAVMVGVLTLWVFTRHINAVLLIALLPFGLAWLAWRLERRRAIAVGTALVVVAAWGGLAVAREDDIWRLNAYGILILRIIPAGEVEPFLNHGLPQITELREEARRGTEGQDTTLRAFNDPRFQQWLDDEWRPVYFSYLIGDPVRTLRRPLADAPTLLSGAPEYASPRPVLPRSLEDFLFSREPGDLAFLLAGALTLWVATALTRGPPPGSLLSWALLVVSFVLLVFTWHLSPGDLGRLLMPAAVLARIAGLLMALFAIDHLLDSASALDGPQDGGGHLRGSRHSAGKSGVG
jgi:hypothetical protein